MENWKPIPGWGKFYEVSDLGRVRSKRWNRILKSSRPKSRWAYPTVSLNVGKKVKCCAVHRLVLLSFVGKPPEEHECCHQNGKKCDNRLANLRWDTRSNNALDRIKHGTMKNFKGENAYAAKLSNVKVRWIRKNAGKFSQRKMGRMFNVSHNVIGYVINRKAWKHVK